MPQATDKAEMPHKVSAIAKHMQTGCAQKSTANTEARAEAEGVH